MGYHQQYYGEKVGITFTDQGVVAPIEETEGD